jgi:16S rRNA (cytidine1402-2'-O)-methyltransferase
MPAGTLYVIATPLGHLGDLSERVVETLRSVPIIAAEDTRHSRRLLNVIEAKPRRLVSYHGYSDERRESLLLELLQGGEDVALVTDAGTPAVSDPGFKVVAAAHEAGIKVVPIPGPSAVATALSAGGLPADRYLFLGFPPRKGRERRDFLQDAIASRWTVVMFEAANRLVALLEDLMAMAAPTRVAVVCRELTKLHEEIRRASLSNLADHYRERPPQGEVTLLLAPASERVSGPHAASADEIRSAVREWLDAGESRRAVARKVAEAFGLARNEAYRIVMES